MYHDSAHEKAFARETDREKRAVTWNHLHPQALLCSSVPAVIFPSSFFHSEKGAD